MSQLSQFLTSYGGSVLFLVILAEQLGLPIPAAPVLTSRIILSDSDSRDI